MQHYHINISYNEERQGYVAEIPDLEGCSGFGTSPTEALARLESAKSAWLESARLRGRPVPEPRYRPAPGDTAPAFYDPLTGLPTRFTVARGETQLCGVALEIDAAGRAQNIQRIQLLNEASEREE